MHFYLLFFVSFSIKTRHLEQRVFAQHGNILGRVVHFIRKDMKKHFNALLKLFKLVLIILILMLNFKFKLFFHLRMSVWLVFGFFINHVLSI
jgi:hypothetical protein